MDVPISDTQADNKLPELVAAELEERQFKIYRRIMTPGNHDFQMYKYDSDKDAMTLRSADECFDEAAAGWRAKGIEIDRRYIDIGNTGLFF